MKLLLQLAEAAKTNEGAMLSVLKLLPYGC
ncbi:MAG: hypothetical protein JWP12_3363 [Bacteroidetes bacterium]|nr:hypothetical protein [Bacteroidota bacterium]